MILYFFIKYAIIYIYMEFQPKEHRSAEFQRFSLDLIDDRFELDDEVRSKATSASIELNGYTREDADLPGFLMVPRTEKGTAASMNFEITSADGKQALSKIVITPEDG